MRKYWYFGSRAALALLALVAALSLFGASGTAWAATGVGQGGPVVTPLPWEAAPGSVLAGPVLAIAPQFEAADPGPDQAAATWTNPAFWIVMGLVVLGSLVIMADFPNKY